MRKYAYLKSPEKHDAETYIHKIMLYESEEGIYLFEYSSPDAVLCISDLFYESLDDLYDEWNDLIDERGWIDLDDPLPFCQHDAFLPIRVKGREKGTPEWGRFEILLNESWVDYKPE